MAMRIQTKVLTLDAEFTWEPTILKMTASVRKLHYSALQEVELISIELPTAIGDYVTPISDAKGEVTSFVICEITEKGHKFRTSKESLEEKWPLETRWLFKWELPSDKNKKPK